MGFIADLFLGDNYVNIVEILTIMAIVNVAAYFAVALNLFNRD